MDAIRIARGFTGRDVVMKSFGAYHGHHDTVMVAMSGEDAEIADRFRLPSRPYGAGVPAAVAGLTVAVPFNDAEAMDRRIEELDREGRKPACVILEPVTMFGVVLPEPGYLEAVREITRRHEVVLIFDEVKCGLSVGPAGAVGRYGVVPDIVTLSKTLGGGLPSGAIGATEEIMSVVADGSVLQVGTYNGNPLVMAAARANLFEVLTPAAFDALDELNGRMIGGCRAVLSEHRAPGYADGLGARGFVTFSPVKVIDYATFKAHENPAVEELRWLYYANRGIYLPPARPEQWTLSVVHSAADVDAYVRVFGELVGELTDSAPAR
jgi:glutamate-1-semialdehyde 2,1-aminomutase